MLGFFKRGLQQVAKGASGTLRGDYSGALCTTDAHARFQEAVLNGRCFYAMTAAAGVAPGTAASTTSAFTLYNPIGSAVMLAVWALSIGRVSGTIGAGYIAWMFDPKQPGAAPPTGTAIIPRNALLSGAQAQTGQGQPLTTATLANAPTQIRVAANTSQEVVGTTAADPFGNLLDPVEGQLIVPPGHALSLQGVAAAGTTPLVVFSVLYEEIDII